MALKKNITTPIGVSAEYWKLNSIEYRYEPGGMQHFHIGFAVFVNEAARRGEYMPVERRNIRVNVQAIPTAAVDFTNEAAMAYNIAKAMPELAGAEDC